MPLTFDKTRDFRLWGVTNQASTVKLPIGDSFGGFAGFPNPLRGTLVWDQCFYVLQGVSVAGGATGGSYTITVMSDAIQGYTGLPIASFVGIGPNTKGTVVLGNTHASPSSPLPTHILISQTAAGGGIWFQCFAVAKQYRGVLGSPSSMTAERVIQGTMLRGTSKGGFTSDAGIAASTTFTLGTTGSNLGLHRMRLWDTAFYWVQAGNSITGTHDVTLIAKSLLGVTFPIATTGTGGALSTAGQKLAIPSLLGGQTPNPTAIIWTVVSAGGVSDARVIAVAKTGRGTLAKT